MVNWLRSTLCGEVFVTQLGSQRKRGEQIYSKKLKGYVVVVYHVSNVANGRKIIWPNS